MTEDNLSAVLESRGDLRLEQRPIPKPGPHELLIAIHTVGICGSDVHYWTKGRIGDFIVRSPMVLGHESSGTVVKIGENVKNLKPGDRICIEPGVPCRFCAFCKSGRYNLCQDVQFCATPPVDGTLCRYYSHAADYCYKLPDHVSFEEGALLEPLSVAVHACKRAGVTAGSSVLVCGAGPIGLLCFLVAKAMGAGQICITDVAENRLKVAKEMGAHHQIIINNNDNSSLVQKIHKSMENPPEVAIECSGVESSIRLAILATKSGGTIVLVGLGPEEVKVPLVNAAVREIDIRGVFRYANCYPVALGLVASGAVDVTPLITHRFKLEETLQAFETSKTGAEGAIKVLIQCEKNMSDQAHLTRN